MSNTRSQKNADLVFVTIEKYINNADDKEAKHYKSLCKRAGGLMRTVGLVQFLTFCQAKGKKTSTHYYDVLLTHLSTEIGFASPDTFISAVRKQNLPEYMQTSRNILSLLQWHKRVADILIDGTCVENDKD